MTVISIQMLLQLMQREYKQEKAFLMILFNYISIMNQFLALLWLLLEDLQ